MSHPLVYSGSVPAEWSHFLQVEIQSGMFLGPSRTDIILLYIITVPTHTIKNFPVTSGSQINSRIPHPPSH